MISVGIIVYFIIGIIMFVLGGFLVVYDYVFFGLFCIVLGIIFIIKGIKILIINYRTFIFGEKCYARVLSCVHSGEYIMGREGYKIYVVGYLPSLQKNKIMKESIGLDGEKYSENTYLLVQYYNNDMNIIKKIDDNEIPENILNSLNESSVEKESLDYIQNEETEKIEQYNKNKEKVYSIINNAEIIYKRSILGIIIIILLIFISNDLTIIKNTVVSSNYIETKAIYSHNINDGDNDYIYKYKDTKEKEYEIRVDSYNYTNNREEIIIKYNKDNPKKYFMNNQLYKGSDFIWVIVRIVSMILLIILFFNEKLLRKIKLSFGK